MSRRQQAIDLLRAGHPTFDYDNIAAGLGFDGHYVNQLCRELAADGLTERWIGRNDKLVNRLLPATDNSTGRPAGPARRRTGT